MTGKTLSAQRHTNGLFPGAPDRSPLLVIQPQKGLFDLDLKALWEYRELLYFLIWRDVKIRYKQTLIGVVWAVLQPFLTMIIFTVIFSKFARISSEGVPYPLFAYTALLPWTFFAQALNRGGGSVVGDAQLVRKIYFPRLIMPIAAAIVPLVDFAAAFALLFGMMLWFGVTPTWGILTLPLLLGFALVTAVAVGLWLAALNVKYRDVGYAIPFLLQCWMYVSPVVYPVSLVPEKWRLLYSLNPMVGVIEGFRWALLNKPLPDVGIMAVSAGVVLVLLWGGIVYFRHMERTFSDIV